MRKTDNADKAEKTYNVELTNTEIKIMIVQSAYEVIRYANRIASFDETKDTMEELVEFYANARNLYDKLCDVAGTPKSSRENLLFAIRQAKI